MQRRAADKAGEDDVWRGGRLLLQALAIFIGVVVYGLMVLRTKTIRREELMDISFGRKIVSICDKLRLW